MSCVKTDLSDVADGSFDLASVPEVFEDEVFVVDVSECEEEEEDDELELVLEF